MVCRVCGKKLDDSAPFCPICGTAQKPKEKTEKEPKQGSSLPVIVGAVGVVLAVVVVVLSVVALRVIREQKQFITDAQSTIASMEETMDTQQSRLNVLTEDVDELKTLADGWTDVDNDLYSGDRENLDTIDEAEPDDVMSDGIISVAINDVVCADYYGCGFELAYDGEETFCVYLDFYNSTGATACYDDFFYLKAFQNGIELEERWITSAVAYDSSTDVQDGYSLTICEAFELRDLSDISFEMYYYTDWPYELVDVMTLSPADY